MLEQLFERMLKLELVRELSVQEVLDAADATDILVVDTLSTSHNRRMSIRDLKLDGQVQEEIKLLSEMDELQGTKFYTVTG